MPVAVPSVLLISQQTSATEPHCAHSKTMPHLNGLRRCCETVSTLEGVLRLWAWLHIQCAAFEGGWGVSVGRGGKIGRTESSHRSDRRMALTCRNLRLVRIPNVNLRFILGTFSVFSPRSNRFVVTFCFCQFFTTGCQAALMVTCTFNFLI